jgi:hypothetical protein
LHANGIADLSAANALLDQLRRHRNDLEKHRELGSTPKAAWNLAKKEKRWALRPAPPCPWWPYVFSQQTRLTVGDDGKVASDSPSTLPLARKSFDACILTATSRCSKAHRTKRLCRWSCSAPDCAESTLVQFCSHRKCNFECTTTPLKKWLAIPCIYGIVPP